MIQNNFYVYMYLDNNNCPFYIGKGYKDRYLISRHSDTQSKNSFLVRKINKVGIENIKIVFLNTNLTEQESHKWEVYWISYIGRRDLKLGTLCNLTDGGEGTTGRVVSEEQKLKMSQYKKGNTYMLGKRHSEETKEKMRVKASNRKGWKHSDEAKLKMSKSRLGNKNAQGSKGRTGQKASDETRQKLSKSLKNWWEKKKKSLPN